MKLQAVLDLIPEIHEFMTPEEMDESTFALAKQYPDIVQVDQVGESTRNYPIYRLKIGSGQKKALIFGCPHPNEPIGAMMIEHLAKILCEQPALLQELDTTFHLIKIQLILTAKLPHFIFCESCKRRQDPLVRHGILIEHIQSRMCSVFFYR